MYSFAINDILLHPIGADVGLSQDSFKLKTNQYILVNSQLNSSTDVQKSISDIINKKKDITLVLLNDSFNIKRLHSQIRIEKSKGVLDMKESLRLIEIELDCIIVLTISNIYMNDNDIYFKLDYFTRYVDGMTSGIHNARTYHFRLCPNNYLKFISVRGNGLVHNGETIYLSEKNKRPTSCY
jgi:hypothetical protein